jgi:hypothetical protein
MMSTYDIWVVATFSLPSGMSLYSLSRASFSSAVTEVGSSSSAGRTSARTASTGANLTGFLVRLATSDAFSVAVASACCASSGRVNATEEKPPFLSTRTT